VKYPTSGGMIVTPPVDSYAHFRINPRTWARDFVSRYNTRIRGKKLAAAMRELGEQIKKELLPFIFCKNCGDKIPRGEEGLVAWATKRKCAACLAKGHLEGAEKRHCRHCGKEISKAAYATELQAKYEALPYKIATPWEESLERGWSTVAICGGCKTTMYEAAKLVREQLKILLRAK
jgi:hypothetical protein